MVETAAAVAMAWGEGVRVNGGGGDGSKSGNDDNVDGFSTATAKQTLNKLLCTYIKLFEYISAIPIPQAHTNRYIDTIFSVSISRYVYIYTLIHTPREDTTTTTTNKLRQKKALDFSKMHLD